MAAPAILGVKAWANYTSAGSGASTTVTNTGTTVSGRGLLALIGGQATNNTPSFSDSKGNTWTKIASLQNGTDAAAMYLCGNPTNVGTNHSFTVNWTDGYSSVAVLELDQAVALDNSSTATDSGTPWDSTLTTLSADCLVVTSTTVYATTGSWALAASGWTWYGQLPVPADASDWDIGLLYKTSATATANAISMTGIDVDGATPHHLIMASLKAEGGSGSTITAAAGTATTSTLAGRATSTSTPTAAAGVATASTLTGRANAASAVTASAGVAATSSLTGRAGVAAAITPVAGQATSSTITAASSAAASATPAAGQATASSLQGSSTAQASISPAVGLATTGTLVGSGQQPGSASILPATGTSTAGTLQGSALVASSIVPAAGVATTSTLSSNGAPARGMEVDFEAAPGPRRAKFVSIKPPLQAALDRRFPDAEEAEPAYSQMRVDEATSALIRAWAAAQGFQTVADDLHVTLAYSRAPVDLSGVALLDGFSVPRAGRALDQFGDAVVLTLTSTRLTEQWQAMRDAGASWDFPGYQPHITITYEKGGVELADVLPYAGPIVLLDEERSALDSDFDAEESATDAAVAAGLVELQNEQLTPELVARLAQQWRPAAPIAPNISPQDAQLQYLRALMAEKQAQEAQAAQLDEQRRRAKAKADDEEAIARAVALLF